MSLSIKAVLEHISNPKTGYMFLFGFSAGLPYALLLGTLYAWLSDAQVDLESMGVFSLIGLAYAFKFLWSPLVDKLKLPFLNRLGVRKSWLIPAQLILALILIILSQLNPDKALGWFSLLAGIGAFASATQDIVIDAWRIDVADERVTVELLSSVYQLGYRLAALAGGALALFLADVYSWPLVYIYMGVIMLLVAILSFFAPDKKEIAELETGQSPNNELLDSTQRQRLISLCLVAAFWGWALFTVITFMISSLSSSPQDRPDSVAFIKIYGPLIVVATVIIPSILAAVLVKLNNNSPSRITKDGPFNAFDNAVNYGFKTLILPLQDLVIRLGWASILVLMLILSYRITDNIWGAFAYPFYLNELQYSKTEVAIASKFFGVGMTILGIALGGALFLWIGRMATLTVGAFTAAASNLLYAQLAAGGAIIDLVSYYSGFSWAVSLFGQDERMARLMLVIMGENIAGGLAGAAFVAYLSSIANKKYSAVQYALLSSLTFLVGTLGRGALGEMIEKQGYFSVFIFTALLGVFAVVLCFLEWSRQRKKNVGV